MKRSKRGSSTPTTFNVAAANDVPLGVDQSGERVVFLASYAFATVDLSTGAAQLHRATVTRPVFSDAVDAFVGRGVGESIPWRPAEHDDYSAFAGRFLANPSVTLNVRTDGGTTGWVYDDDISGDGTLVGVATRDPLDRSPLPAQPPGYDGGYMYLVRLN